MNSNNNKISNLSTCYTEEVLQDYIAGNLDAKKAKQVAQHIENCEMCADVSDGLRLMSDSSNLSDKVNLLNSMIDSKVKKRKSNFFLTHLRSIAAAILILVALGSVLMINKYSSKISDPQITSLEKEVIKEILVNQEEEEFSNNLSSKNTETVSKTQITEQETLSDKIQLNIVDEEENTPVEYKNSQSIVLDNKTTGDYPILSIDEDKDEEFEEDIERFDGTKIADETVIVESGDGSGYSYDIELKEEGSERSLRTQNESDDLPSNYYQPDTNITSSENIDIVNERANEKTRKGNRNRFWEKEKTSSKKDDIAENSPSSAANQSLSGGTTISSSSEEQIYIDDFETLTFDIVEQKPEYPGGDTAMMKFIVDNIEYPESAMKDSIQGIVYVQFVIDTSGNVIEGEVIREVASPLDSAALQVIRKMPKWQAGKQFGKKVRVNYIIPIKFILD